MIWHEFRRGFWERFQRMQRRRAGDSRRDWSPTPALVSLLEERTLPSALLVTNLNDSGAGSLRSAVATANDSPGADVIRFQPHLAGTIVLTTGQMEIRDALTIDGPGMSRLTISGNFATRVFKMEPGTQLTIDDLTIANSRNTIQDDIGIKVTRGGAILNDGGELTLLRVTMLNNQAIDTRSGSDATRVVGGGAVVNSGNAKLTASHSLFIGNSVTGGTSYAFGGAIGNVSNSVAIIDDCTFLGNCSSGGGTSYGGAIGNIGSSQLTVTNSVFDGNSARGTAPERDAFGGAIATRPGTVVSSGSTTTIDRSRFTNNRALGGAGSASQAGGDAGGGALYNVESTLIVQRSQFVGNQALGGSGKSSGGNAYGGAIDATAVNPSAPPLTQISNSQFVANLALSGSSSNGAGGLAAGGALYNAIGRMELVQDCIVGNVALGGFQGRGIGGGIYNLATVTIDQPTRRTGLYGNVASTSHNNSFGPSTPV
ncbi:MAG: hypothetical protein ACKV0T_05135 [Planctomycetales bacterium]